MTAETGTPAGHENRCLLTPQILRKEVQFQMEQHGLHTTEPISYVRVDPVKPDADSLCVHCGDWGVELPMKTQDLLMSLDDYSNRYIIPEVCFMKSQHSKGA
jgi:hypothetical protein